MKKIIALLTPVFTGIVFMAFGSTVFAGGAHELVAGVSVHGTFQGNTNSCGFCHNVHEAVESNNLFQGEINHIENTELSGTNQFCIFCHDGTAGFETAMMANTGKSNAENPDFNMVFNDGKNEIVPYYNAHGEGYVNDLKNLRDPLGSDQKAVIGNGKLLPGDSTGGSFARTGNDVGLVQGVKEDKLKSLHPSCIDCHSPHGSINAYGLRTKFGLAINVSGVDTRQTYDTSQSGMMTADGKHVNTRTFCSQCHNAVTRVQANVDLTADSKIDSNDYVTLKDTTLASHQGSDDSIIIPGQKKTCGIDCHILNTPDDPLTANREYPETFDYVHAPTYHKAITHY
ncbi:MAG: hypothetical protein K0R18_2360 [Bacillales bacterium]|jgi:hypothetical protein|nr:hypothetical protein [Bacillales bacterium]